MPALGSARRPKPPPESICVSQRPKGTLSMRSDFGLWLKRDSPQIGKPETDSMLVEVPGADFLLDLTRAVDGSVHHKKRNISMEFVCDRPKAQWASIRAQLEARCKGNGALLFCSGR